MTVVASPAVQHLTCQVLERTRKEVGEVARFSCNTSRRLLFKRVSGSMPSVDRMFAKFCQGTFKLALLQKYGDMVTAWFQCIDVKREGRIQEPLLCT